MCRLLGMITSAPAMPEWGLVSAPHALLAQSRANAKALQRDGWGLGWYRDRHAQWFKSPRPIFEEEAVVRQLVAKTATRMAVAHVRRASNPLGLARPKLLRIENTQPFTFKNYIFAHNGTLNIPREVMETLGPWRERVKGVNDSEVLFWLLVNFLDDSRDFKTAFGKMIRHIETVWKKVEKKPGTEPFTGLNVIFCDGTSLYAACHCRTVPRKKSDSLCTRGWPFWRMCYRKAPGQVWVASEPLDQKNNWEPLQPGHYLKAVIDRGTVRTRVGRLSTR